MVRFTGLLSILFASAAFVTGCSGGGAGPGGGSGGGGTPTEPPPIVTTQNYPASMATAAGGGTAWAITQVKTTLYGQFHNAGGNSYDTLRVDVSFAQNVANALPSPGAKLISGNQLGIAIGLDNGANGHFSTCSESRSFTPFQYGSDSGNDPSRLPDGNYSILDLSGPIYEGPSNPGSEAQTIVSANVITQVFYLETIGALAGAGVPNLKLSVFAINGTGGSAGVSDCVPAGNAEIATS